MIEIEDLKTLKEALNKVPDEVLEKYIFGFNDNGEMGMGHREFDEMQYEECTKRMEKEFKNKALQCVGKWFDQLIKETANPDDTDGGLIYAKVK